MNALVFALSLTVTTTTLAATPKPAAAGKTQIIIEVKPSSTVVFVDGKRKGTGSKLITIPTTPGRHLIKLVHGLDEHQEMLVVKKGESKKWTWAFEDDRPGKKVDESPAAGSDGAGAGGGEDDDGPPPDDGEEPQE